MMSITTAELFPNESKGNQLTAKTYTLAKGGAVAYVTTRPTTLSGQAVYILEPGLYYFNEISPRDFSKEKQPVEYVITVVPDHTVQQTFHQHLTCQFRQMHGETKMHI
ncbi:hypothetical protein [Chryseobacterium oryzae]|uniref:Uncharacterized protein n=1 Tax=Chryseobacterium oryzae TaxID=2929799 RepID=A0ABY4BP97_9FLAO|nr:hypothetical protein [Chryseobacterium oryzae]UOE39626.1 hypothetical protein MTP08_06485 [Chryseobacterium oryzae]